MKTVLIEPQDIRRAINEFKDQITKGAVSTKRKETHFPGGAHTVGTEYTLTCSLGKLFVMIPDRDWGERIPLLFTLNPKTSNFTSDAEINIPLGLNRRVGGCIVEEDSAKFICNRGRFTSFKSSIPKQASLEFFKNSIISVVDGDKDANLICIADLSSPNLVEEIASFVNELKVLKGGMK
ncbi:MAG TPA: hypothetical protein PLE74_04725 [Candidatus Cloacimonadota bacterium]|nr:hypothetical protein [Candidatus Cloacimonadota bacterium]